MVRKRSPPLPVLPKLKVANSPADDAPQSKGGEQNTLYVRIPFMAFPSTITAAVVVIGGEFAYWVEPGEPAASAKLPTKIYIRNPFMYGSQAHWGIWQNFTEEELGEYIAENKACGLVRDFDELDGGAAGQTLLNSLQLQDGAKYTLVRGKGGLPARNLEQIKQVWRDIRDRSIWELRRTTAEFAADWLKSKGHYSAKQYIAFQSGTRSVAPKDGSFHGEIDAAAVAPECAVVLVCEASLNCFAAVRLQNLLHDIRVQAARNGSLLAELQGKTLVGGLAGFELTKDEEDAQELKLLCRREGFQIFLKDGKGFSVEESFPSFTTAVARPSSSTRGPG